AFLDLLILFALSQASNTTKGAFGNNFLLILLQPQNIDVSSSAFLGLILAFFVFYYAYYVIIIQMPLNDRTVRVLTGACLFYAVLCIAFVAILFLLLFGSGSALANDWFLRGATYAFNAFIFWRVGSTLASRLHLRRRVPWPWPL